MKALLNQMYRYGRGRAHLMARHPSVIPWPLVLTTSYLILTLLTLALVGPKAAGMMTAIPIALWMLLIVTESIRIAGVTPAAARVAVAFLVIHLGLEFGFWRGIPEFRRFRSPVSS